MHWGDLAEMVGWALGCSLPLVLLGWLLIWRARTRSAPTTRICGAGLSRPGQS